MNMLCEECGIIFTARRYDQRFCCTQHKNNYHQRSFYQKEKDKRSDYLTASNEIDTLKEENERLKEQIKERDEQIDNWKEIVRRHHRILLNNKMMKSIP
jgi:uncharacterized protein YlxW (UPF0749 family)